MSDVVRCIPEMLRVHRLGRGDEESARKPEDKERGWQEQSRTWDTSRVITVKCHICFYSLLPFFSKKVISFQLNNVNVAQNWGSGQQSTGENGICLLPSLALLSVTFSVSVDYLSAGRVLTSSSSQPTWCCYKTLVFISLLAFYVLFSNAQPAEL